MRLIASTSAIFGADEACAMLRIRFSDAVNNSFIPLYSSPEHAIRLSVAYKATSKCRGVPRLFFIYTIRSPHWPRNSVSSSTSEESTTSLPLFLSYECFNPGIKNLVGAKVVLVD